MGEGIIVIRKFQGRDREDVRRISCDTAFIREAESNLFSDDEILADALTLYYTDYEPGSCFVATYSGKVIGYIIGSKDTGVMSRTFWLRIAPLLLIRAIQRGIFFERSTRRFLLHCIASFLRGEFLTPNFSKEYPAVLHINIDRGFRRFRIGSRLIERYLDFLTESGVKGVHFCTVSEGAKVFFTKSGFNLLFEGRRTFLKYLSGRDLPLYIFGRKL